MLPVVKVRWVEEIRRLAGSPMRGGAGDRNRDLISGIDDGVDLKVPGLATPEVDPGVDLMVDGKARGGPGAAIRTGAVVVVDRERVGEGDEAGRGGRLEFGALRGRLVGHGDEEDALVGVAPAWHLVHRDGRLDPAHVGHRGGTGGGGLRLRRRARLHGDGGRWDAIGRRRRRRKRRLGDQAEMAAASGRGGVGASGRRGRGRG